MDTNPVLNAIHLNNHFAYIGKMIASGQGDLFFEQDEVEKERKC